MLWPHAPYAEIHPDEYGSPATVASAGGRYFGFVTGGALPVTVATQYLAAAWDQNCFSFISSPAVACFETTALRWVKEAFGLPASVEGAVVTGATMPAASAILDRLLHHAEIIPINGRSYRLQPKTKRAAPPERSASSSSSMFSLSCTPRFLPHAISN